MYPEVGHPSYCSSRIASVSPHRSPPIDAALTALLYRILAPSPSKDRLPPHSSWLRQYSFCSMGKLCVSIRPSGSSWPPLHFSRLGPAPSYEKCRTVSGMGASGMCAYPRFFSCYGSGTYGIQIVVSMIQIITQVTCLQDRPRLFCAFGAVFVLSSIGPLTDHVSIPICCFYRTPIDF